MKRILISLFLLFSFVNLANAKNNITYNLYYFMGDVRCNSCHKIESYTKEVYDELNNKNINFQIINVDKKENKHFVEEYNIYAKSVVISKLVDEKEVQYKNLDKIWNYLGDREKFKSYLRSEIDSFLIEKTEIVKNK